MRTRKSSFSNKSFIASHPLITLFMMIAVTLSLYATLTSANKTDEPLVLENNLIKETMMTQPEKLIDFIEGILVDISEQKLYLYNNGQLIKQYPISTSKYGIGNTAGSNKTPLGRHRIKTKIGDDAPKYSIFIGRKDSGKLANMNEGRDDLVTSRIMWLEGLEAGKNSGKGIDSYQRYIYIHGTAEEDAIGTPASHGCIRMYNEDVIDLYPRVDEGTLVTIQE